MPVLIPLNLLSRSKMLLPPRSLQRPGTNIKVRHPLRWALANETLLTQCASVLLDNAVKFVAHDVTPEIVVWTEHSSSVVKLWVQDNGIGIAPEYHAKIFNIIETLHPSAMFPGRGIGLPLPFGSL